MSQNLLKNGGFELDWSVDKSHTCLIFPKDGDAYGKNVGNIFVPSGGWVFWFYHDPGEFDQPEGRDAHLVHDAHRVKSGEKAFMYFTFFRRHDAGLYQQVKVTPGTRLRLTAWAHSWSNTEIPGHESCFENGRCSCGVGKEAAFILEGDAPELNGDPWNDAIGNFTFLIGIDPTGGLNPFADTVVWGQGAHIYNTYAQVPAVEAVAEGTMVTMFLRSRTMWGFKHNDSYWEDIELKIIGQVPDEPRGLPRVQYERSYVLLFPEADAAWACAVVDASWDKHRFTVGGSADDAGVGAISDKTVIVVNPQMWE